MTNEKIIELSPSDGFLLVNALRYARTRDQRILDYTCWCLTYHWPDLPTRTRQTIANDVALEVELRHADSQEAKEYRRRENPNWEKLLDLAEQEQEKEND